MTIRFNVTDADLKLLEQRTWRTSPWLKRNRLLVAAGIAATLTFIATLHRGLGVAVAATLVVLHLIAVWVPLTIAFVLRRAQARKRHTQLLDGPVEMEITPDGLKVSDKQDETRYTWDQIGPVVTTPTHTFISIARKSAFVIPHQRVESGNYPAFRQAFAHEYIRHSDHAGAILDSSTVASDTATGSST